MATDPMFMNMEHMETCPFTLSGEASNVWGCRGWQRLPGHLPSSDAVTVPHGHAATQAREYMRAWRRFFIRQL